MTRTIDKRLLLLGGVCVAVMAVLVAFAGTQARGVGSWRGPNAPLPKASGTAPTYRDLRGDRRGPNADMYRSAGNELPAAPPVEVDARVRASRRAYHGAAPTVPHDVSQRMLDCAGCHDRGVAVAGKIAPRMMHPARPSCTQCHVSSSDPRPIDTPAERFESDFVGWRGGVE